MQVRKKWQHLYIIPLVDVASEIGVTWLELFVLLYMRGGNAITPDDSKRHLRQTHAAGFRAFQSRSRTLFRFATDDVKPLTRSHLVRHAGNQKPLARYGLLANLSQLPFRLSLGDTLLHAALCSYSGRVPSASLIPTRLRSARLKSPRFAPWAHLGTFRALHDAATRVLSNHDVTSEHDQLQLHEHLTQHGLLLHCPWCNVASDMRQRNMYDRGK